MKKILILGGAGFIGKTLTKILALEYPKRTIIVADTNESELSKLSASLKGVNHVHFHLVNMPDHISGSLFLPSFDEIYYLAGMLGVKNVVVNPYESIHGNVCPLFDVLDNVKNGVKFLYTSSSEVYAKNDDFSEDSPLILGQSLRWNYACSKILGEFTVRSRVENSIIVRLFNVVGEDQTPNTGMVIPSFVDKALKGEPIVLFGSPDFPSKRKFCYVKDCVRLLITLMEGDHSGIYNVGNDEGEPITMKDLAIKILKKMNKDEDNIIYKSAHEVFGVPERNYEDVLFRNPNIERLRRNIEVPKFTTLDETLDSIIKNSDNWR